MKKVPAVPYTFVRISYLSQVLKKFIPSFPRLIRNKYSLTILIFIAWMSLFDSNDFFRQYKVYRKYRELSEEAQRRTRLNEETRYSLELLKDKKHLEQFAREEYFFKKNNEDIFVIVEE